MFKKFNFKNSFQISNFKFQIHKKGFTLVEMLLYMGFLTAFLVVLTQIFVSTLNVQLESEANSSIQQDGRFIMTRLTYDIERATSISTPASLGGQSSNLVMTISGGTYTYAISGNNLVLTTSLGTDQINGEGTKVSNLLFKRIGNSGGKNTFQITFTLTSVVKRQSGNPDVKNFSTTVGLR